MEDYRLEQTGQEVQDILNGAAMNTDLVAETERAEGAEGTLQDNIDAEARARQDADGLLQQGITDEELRAKAAEEQAEAKIVAIEGKIPSGASSENKLATEEYVDDSVATNTATYRGNYNLVSDLHLGVDATHEQIAFMLSGTIATADNNDYCFVQVPTSAETPTEIRVIERYKFNGEVWGFEYALNNSGYTAAQWAAINSGITSALVTKLGALPTAADLAAALLGKQDVLTFDSAPTQGSNNPAKSGGIWQMIDDEKGARINRDAELQAAIEAILVLIPSAATALNQLADKAFVNSSVATETATFRGTYNLVSDLHLSLDATHDQIAAALGNAISTADNNDYAFVQIPTSVDTPTEIRITERYKFNGTAWAYEYDLNNSGFTAAQWAAINSGITALLVSKLSELPTATELVTALAGKQAVLTFDNAPTQDSDNPVKSGGIYTAIKAVTDLIPSEATDINQLADKAYVLAQILAATPAFKGQFTTLADLQAVASPKAGDIGIVRTKDSDGYDVFTFYQYLNNQWNVFFTLSHHPQTKPATTGTTGDYPYNGMGRVVIPKNMVNIAEQGEPENIVNLLTQEAFEDGDGNPLTNTIYVIQNDFTLGENITVPANCVLEFDGGSICVGSGENKDTIIVDNTYICGIGDCLVKLNGYFFYDTIDIFGVKPSNSASVNSANIARFLNSVTPYWNGDFDESHSSYKIATLIFGLGKYCFNEPISVNTRCNICGKSIDASILYFSGSDGLVFSYPATHNVQESFSVYNLTIASVTGNAIDLAYSNNFMTGSNFHDLILRAPAGAGLYTTYRQQNIYGCQFNNIKFTGCKYCVANMDLYGCCIFNGCIDFVCEEWFHNCDLISVEFYGGNVGWGGHMKHFIFNNAGYNTKPNHNIKVVGCRFEELTSNIVAVIRNGSKQLALYITFEDCYFEENLDLKNSVYAFPYGISRDSAPRTITPSSYTDYFPIVGDNIFPTFVNTKQKTLSRTENNEIVTITIPVMAITAVGNYNSGAGRLNPNCGENILILVYDFTNGGDGTTAVPLLYCGKSLVYTSEVKNIIDNYITAKGYVGWYRCLSINTEIISSTYRKFTILNNLSDDYTIRISDVDFLFPIKPGDMVTVEGNNYATYRKAYDLRGTLSNLNTIKAQLPRGARAVISDNNKQVYYTGNAWVDATGTPV